MPIISCKVNISLILQEHDPRRFVLARRSAVFTSAASAMQNPVKGSTCRHENCANNCSNYRCRPRMRFCQPIYRQTSLLKGTRIPLYNLPSIHGHKLFQSLMFRREGLILCASWLLRFSHLDTQYPFPFGLVCERSVWKRHSSPCMLMNKVTQNKVGSIDLFHVCEIMKGTWRLDRITIVGG